MTFQATETVVPAGNVPSRRNIRPRPIDVELAMPVIHLKVKN
jgi:hypothetical protein